ncbi:MAG: transcriptional repressor [Elusimicrobia bacterium]|nr:transcriptional repressor [Elusimicrobiota bacterium]
MEKVVLIFKDYLRKRGLKFTPEREVVLREVFSLHKHFDAEQLYQNLYKRKKKISRASVYRTLPLLVRAGLITETLRCQGRTSYEHIFGHGHHDHMLCIGCGKVIEFRSEKIEKLQKEICRKYGFKPVEHRLGIKGYCRECQKKIKMKKKLPLDREK